MEQAESNAALHVNSNGSHLPPYRRIDDTEPSIRVGTLYQAILPPFAPPVSPPPRPSTRLIDDSDTAASDARLGVSGVAAEEAVSVDMGGSAVWLASRIKQSRTRLSTQHMYHELPYTMCNSPSLRFPSLASFQPVCSLTHSHSLHLTAWYGCVSGQLLTVRSNTLPQKSSQLTVTTTTSHPPPLCPPFLPSVLPSYPPAPPSPHLLWYCFDVCTALLL